MRITTATDDGDDCERLGRRLDKLNRRLRRMLLEAKEGIRQFLLAAGTKKFGEPSPAVLQRFRGIAFPDVPDDWMQRLSTATSWGEWLNSV